MYKLKGSIFLKEASKQCGYSQAYLSLKARQGELRAFKLGGSWATKKEWLREYLKTNYKTQAPKPKQILKIKSQAPELRTQGFRYTLRYNLVVVLILFFLSFLIPFSLISGRDVLESIKNSFQAISKEIATTEIPKITISDWQPKAHEVSYLIGKEIINQKDKTFLLSAKSQNNLENGMYVFQEFGEWYKEQAGVLIHKITHIRVTIEIVD